jgi:hypothetical protein
MIQMGKVGKQTFRKKAATVLAVFVVMVLTATSASAAISGNAVKNATENAKSSQGVSARDANIVLTDVSPAVTGVGDNVYFFAKSLDGRIFFNRAKLGQGGVGWVEVEGNGRTDTAPAAGAVGNHVFVAIKGTDGHIYVNQADLGQPFGQWFGGSSNDIVTDVAPAVTGVGDNVYFFAKSLDGRIFFNRAKLGQGGVGWVEVKGNGHTDTAPAAGAVGNHVFVSIKGTDGLIYTNQADLGGPFGQWFGSSNGVLTERCRELKILQIQYQDRLKNCKTDIQCREAQRLLQNNLRDQRNAGCFNPLPLKTNVTPAVTGVGDNVYFFAKSLDGRIYYTRAKLGQGGGDWVEVEGNGNTDLAPAAGAVGNHVFVAIKGKGSDGHIYVNQADLGQPFGQWFG